MPALPTPAMFFRLPALAWIASLVPEPVFWTLAMLTSALFVGSIVRLAVMWAHPEETDSQRLASLRTWWTLLGMFIVAVFAGRVGICLLMGMASLLALREYFRLPNIRAVSHPAIVAMAYGWSTANYLLIAANDPDAFLKLSPLLGLIAGALISLFTAGTTDHVRRSSSHYWGMMVLAYGPAHLPLLLTLPEFSVGGVPSVGGVVYLVVLTQLGDIVQALVGRRFRRGGGHYITPQISPRKTWEGFLAGGIAVTGLATLIGPQLLPPIAGDYLPTVVVHAALGTLIFLAAFSGGSNTSAIKRDAGVKDSGTLLAGMGGVIDRLDSFTFAAPLLYYVVSRLVPLHAG